MSHAVGVDAGASHTEAVVVDRDRREVARHRGAPGAVRPGGADRAAAAIAATIREAVAAAGPEPVVAAVVVGAAGAGREAERRALGEALRARLEHAPAIHVLTDVEIALESVFPEKPGIVVIAGSGSVACARDPEWRVRRAGGLGWQLGDEGSGYAVGRAALAAVGRAADGRGPHTALSAAVARAAAARTLDDVIRWAQGASPREVAALAEAVCRVAVDGDTAAREIVARAGRDLAQLVGALLPHVGAGASVPVAAGGGLLRPPSPIRTAFAEAVRAQHARATLVEATVDAAWGAATLALKLPR